MFFLTRSCSHLIDRLKSLISETFQQKRKTNFHLKSQKVFKIHYNRKFNTDFTRPRFLWLNLHTKLSMNSEENEKQKGGGRLKDPWIENLIYISISIYVIYWEIAGGKKRHYCREGGICCLIQVDHKLRCLNNLFLLNCALFSNLSML